MAAHNCRCDVAEPHSTFGACMRFKGVRVAYCQSAAGKDYTAEKRWQKDLDAYASARREGIQPASTRREAVTGARALSDKTGTAFQA